MTWMNCNVLERATKLAAYCDLSTGWASWYALNASMHFNLTLGIIIESPGGRIPTLLLLCHHCGNSSLKIRNRTLEHMNMVLVNTMLLDRIWVRRLLQWSTFSKDIVGGDAGLLFEGWMRCLMWWRALCRGNWTDIAMKWSAWVTVCSLILLRRRQRRRIWFGAFRGVLLMMWMLGRMGITLVLFACGLKMRRELESLKVLQMYCQYRRFFAVLDMRCKIVAHCALVQDFAWISLWIYSIHLYLFLNKTI